MRMQGLNRWMAVAGVAAMAAGVHAETAKAAFESEVGRYLAGHSLSGVKTCDDVARQ